MAMFDEIGELLTGGSNLGALASFLGENDNAARSAVGASVPILLGGMAKRSRTGDGAKAMFDLVSGDDGSLLDNIGGFLSGGDTGGLGSNLVSAMLGSRRSAVEEGLASSTGLGLGTITKFLPMMAPMVMSFLGRKAKSGNMDQAGLAGALASERTSMEKGGLGGLLGLLDGDDDAADDAGFISGLSRLSGLGGLGALGGGAAGAAGIAGDAASGISGKLTGGAAAAAAGAAGIGGGAADKLKGLAGKAKGMVPGGDADVDLPDVDMPEGKGISGKVVGGAAAAAAGVAGVGGGAADKLKGLAGKAKGMVPGGDADVDLPDVDMPEGKGISGKVVGGAAAAAAGVAGVGGGAADKLKGLAGKAKDMVPDAKLPDVDLPDAKLPDVDLPDAKLPDVDLPDAKLPDVDLPDAKLPDVDLPDAKLPDVDLPDVDLPEGKGISGKLAGGVAAAGIAGAAASGKLGDLAGKAKDMVPDVDLPDVDIKKPEIKKPDVNIKKPDVEIKKPKVTKPKVTKPEVKTPKVEVNKPKVTKPDIKTPKVDVDKAAATVKGNVGKVGADVGRVGGTVKAAAGGAGGAAVGREVAGGGGGWGWLKWLLPLLLLLALIGLLLWACNRDSGSDTATAAAATATPVPATATAVPATATAVPATATAVPATAVPTAVPAPTEVPEPTPVPEPEVEVTCASLIDVANDAGLTTLVTAVTAGGLGETLTTSGPLTILAPSDDAFGSLNQDVLNAALADPALLAEILTYHVVGGAVTSGDITTGPVTTLSGSNVYTRTGDGVRINNANVVAADVEADQCVVHVIDQVLIPPALLSTVGGTLNDAVGGGVIRFAPGTANLTADSKDTLNAICGFLGGQPVDVAIGGISVVSDTERAQQRSDAVRDHLIACGLSESQVEALIITMNDANGDSLNLLVEFTG